MELFSVVDEGEAIIRLPRGVHKQVKVYQRAGVLYVPHGGGYVRIVPQLWDSSYSTGHPEVKVIEIAGPGISTSGKVLKYAPGGR